MTFKPTTTGPITGTLTLTDSDVTGTQTIALSGTGAGIFSATALAVSSGNIVFGTNTTLTATVTGNAGTTPTGTVNFLDGATVLKSAAALNASGVATFTTTTPLAVGSHSITAVYSGDGTYPTSTSAVWTIVVAAPPVPDFTFSLSNGQIVIPANLPASSTTVNVAMVNGFSSTVSFSCSGLPTASRCSFTPATLSATGSSTLTVTINTSSAALRSPFGGMGEGVLACGLLALPFMLRRKTRTRSPRDNADDAAAARRRPGGDQRLRWRRLDGLDTQGDQQRHRHRDRRKRHAHRDHRGCGSITSLARTGGAATVAPPTY